MKQCIKKSLCILISSIILITTIAMGFVSSADTGDPSTHYIDNANFKKISIYELEQKWKNGDKFIFVIYASYQDICRDIGTNVYEKYWMNEYDATIYGVDVFDASFFGDPLYSCAYEPDDPNSEYSLRCKSDSEYALKHSYFYCPDFIRDKYLSFFNVSYREVEGYERFAPKSLPCLPITGFVMGSEAVVTEDMETDYYQIITSPLYFEIPDNDDEAAGAIALELQAYSNATEVIIDGTHVFREATSYSYSKVGEPFGDPDNPRQNYKCTFHVSEFDGVIGDDNNAFMTLDLYESLGDSDSTDRYVACFPQTEALVLEYDDPETEWDDRKPPLSVYNRGYWLLSDFQSTYSRYPDFSSPQQNLLDMNVSFFTFLGENPIRCVDAIPEAADIDPGQSVQTLQKVCVALHDYKIISAYNVYPHHYFANDYNFDGSGPEIHTNANTPSVLAHPPYDDDYELNVDEPYYEAPNDTSSNRRNAYVFNYYERFEDDYYDFSENNMNRTLEWSSSDDSKVTVDQNGKITAVSPYPCEVIITCKAVDQRLAPWAPTTQPYALRRDFPIRIIPHNWDIQILPGDEATCLSEGVRTYTCMDEGCTKRHYVFREVVTNTDVHDLHWTNSSDNPPSCKTETDGVQENVCSICGKVLETRTIDWENSHIFETVVIQEGSCTEDRITRNICTVCGIVEEGSEKREYATGHEAGEYTYLIGHEPTCTEEGTEVQYCSKCLQRGEYTVIEGSERTVAPLGHDWGDPYTDENGDKVHDCARCSVTERLSLWERILAFFKELIEKLCAMFNP